MRPEVFQVLFAGGPDPTRLNPDYWVDPSDLTTLRQTTAGATAVTTAGDPVGRALDKRAGALFSSAPSDAARPVYQTSGSLRYLDFDGTDDLLVSPAVTSIITATSFDVFVAAKVNAITTNNTGSNSYENDAVISIPNGEFGLHFRSAGKIQAFLYPTAVEDDYTAGDPFVAHMRYTGATLSLTVNNRPTVRAAAASYTPTNNLRIGGNYSTAFTDCDVYGLFFRKELLSWAEVAAMKKYLAAKIGITI
jgi:hypothetical protein